MTEYFTESLHSEVKAQRKKCLLIYYIALGAFVLMSVGFLVWYIFMPYKSPNITLVKCIHLPLTGIFVIFSFIYLGIPFKRCNKFYRYCEKLSVGRKETSVCTFYTYNEEMIQKDGVDCKALVFFEWNKYKGEYYEREVFVFAEKEFPVLEKNAVYEFVTQGNFLISYRKATEDENSGEEEKETERSAIEE